MLVYVADVQPLELATVLGAKLCCDENVRFRFFAKNLGIFSFSRKCVRKIMTKRYFRGIFFCHSRGRVINEEINMYGTGIR